MQRIDYEYYILLHSLSGINLACLDIHVLGPFVLPVLRASLCALSMHHLSKDVHSKYLLMIAEFPAPNACYGVVLYYFNTIRWIPSIEFFGDRSSPTDSIYPHLPLSDRLIVAGWVVYILRTRSFIPAYGMVFKMTTRWRAMPDRTQDASNVVQIKFYLSHAPNTTGVVDLKVKCLLYKPLTNNAVLRKSPKKSEIRITNN